MQLSVPHKRPELHEFRVGITSFETTMDQQQVSALLQADERDMYQLFAELDSVPVIERSLERHYRSTVDLILRSTHRRLTRPIKQHQHSNSIHTSPSISITIQISNTAVRRHQDV